MSVHKKINEKQAQIEENVDVYNSRHSFASPVDKYHDSNANFVLANEYLDFIEFLQNELGLDELKNLQRKFFKQQSIANERAYKKFKRILKKR